MITQTTLIDCGPLSLEFFNDDESQTVLDNKLFSDFRIRTSAYNLVTKYSKNVLKKGIYPIKYRVYHSNYPTNVVVLEDPFIVEIIDPCDNLTQLTASVLTDQEYTIT